MATYTIGDKVKIKAGEDAGKSGVVCATKGMSAFVRVDGEDGTSASLVAFADLETDGAADAPITEEATMADAGEADGPYYISRSFLPEQIVVNAEQVEPTAENAVKVTSRTYPECRGEVNGCRFVANVFDDCSGYGIKRGRVSKLTISDKDGNCIVRYDRGWDVKPESKEANAAFNEVLKALESLKPETRGNWKKVSYKGKTYYSECVDKYGSGWWLSQREGDKDRGIWANPKECKVMNAETYAERVACNGNPKVAEKWLHDEIKRTTWENCRVKINGSEYTVEVPNGLEENAKFVAIVRAAVVKLVETFSRWTNQVGKINSMQASGGKIVFKTTIDIAATNASTFSSNPVVNAAMEERAANAGGKE